MFLRLPVWARLAGSLTFESGVTFGLYPKSLKFRKFMDVRHPAKSFCRLYLHCRR
jgi:hypothetical protein